MTEDHQPDNDGRLSHKAPQSPWDEHICKKCKDPFKPKNLIQSRSSLCQKCLTAKLAAPTPNEKKALRLQVMAARDRAREEKRINQEAEKQLKRIEKEQAKAAKTLEKARLKELAKVEKARVKQLSRLEA